MNQSDAKLNAELINGFIVSQSVPLGHPLTWESSAHAPFQGYLEMVHLLQQLQKQNDDALVVLDGPEGSGKSTVAFQLATAIQPDWEPETGLIIDYEDWESLYDLGTGRVFVLDEGGDLMFSRDSMQRENKLVVRMFQMARIFNHIIIVCCPNIHWVDVYVRDHRALIYGHAHKVYHAEGVRRGIISWHWPSRKFNWQASEWETRWNVVGHSRFRQIPNELKAWISYEQLKRLKVQKRQMQLMDGIRKAKDRKA